MSEKELPIYKMSFSKIYPLLLEKVEKKGRTKAQLDELIEWLLGYDNKTLKLALKNELTVKEFFENAPRLNPLRKNIKGVVCGVRVEDIKEPLMQEIRYLDKLVDELVRLKNFDKKFASYENE